MDYYRDIATIILYRLVYLILAMNRSLKTTLQITIILLLITLVIIAFVLITGVQCISVKTGLNKISSDIEMSKKHDVFLYKMLPDKKHVIINKDNSFEFGEVWVEQNWTYQCKYGLPYIERTNEFRQLIYSIKNKKGEFDLCDYYLAPLRLHTATPLCSQPMLLHNDKDKISFLFLHAKIGEFNFDNAHIIDTIHFTRE